MKSVNLYDYIVLGGYFVFMLAIGLYFMKINKGGKDYFAGGSMIPWWVSGMTLYMSNFSAWTFTGAAGFAYATGWFAILYFGVWSIAYYTGSHITASRWRRTRSISPVEYTYTRFNIATQQLLSIVIATNFTLSAGVQLAATCKLLAPVMGLDITMVTLVTGTVILLYTFMGGLWAVSITDVVQGVILLSITFIVMPLALNLVGGFGNLFEALPAISFDQTYNGVHYTEHWVISILVIMTFGTAAGGAQRFYSVKDERDAKRVGKLAGGLFLTVPLVFGIPPLVASVIWPDLSQVDFFKPYIDSNPQDLVFIALCLKLLPNGLIGVFLAAMLAATMSALSSVFNMVSSILSRDVYQGLIKPDITDRGLLTVGRTFSVIIGLTVTVLAVVFVNSQFGIFNWMQVFFTLLNIPVVVPVVFGLLVRKVPKWSAVAAITWGLLVGVATRFVLGWDIGPQVYTALLYSLFIFMASRKFGMMYAGQRIRLLLPTLAVIAVTGALFSFTLPAEAPAWQPPVAWAMAAVIGLSIFFFARLFASETDAEREMVEAFFKKLDTPIDVAREVFGAGKKQVSTFPLVGGTTVVMGLLMGLIFFTELTGNEARILGVMIAVMIIFGVLMWYFGKKSEIRSAAQYQAVVGETEPDEPGEKG